jgi:hypothetical protein
LEASVLFTQLEVGTQDQFLTCSSLQYGHLATISFAVQLWSECEPFGIELQASKSIIWTPYPVLTNDIFLMDLATTAYDKKGSNMINHCRLYLQVISLVDILMYDLQTIHPSYVNGDRPPSCQSNIYWPPYISPSKHFWKLWRHFIRFHATPLVSSSTFFWSPSPQIRPNIVFFKHCQSIRL